MIVFLEPVLDGFYDVIDLRVVLDIVSQNFKGFLKLFRGGFSGNHHLEKPHGATFQSIFIFRFPIKAFQNIKGFDRIIKMT